MRGKGLGTVLLFDAFEELRDEGREDAIVHWTDLLFFYTQVPGLNGYGTTGLCNENYDFSMVMRATKGPRILVFDDYAILRHVALEISNLMNPDRILPRKRKTVRA